MRSLSILFTNSTLSHRAGSELWVRDVCRTLVARRHRPIAFSLVTGPIAGELRAATVPVVTDLDSVAAPPDLIHGHHHLETLIAALHFFFLTACDAIVRGAMADRTGGVAHPRPRRTGARFR